MLVNMGPVEMHNCQLRYITADGALAPDKSLNNFL